MFKTKAEYFKTGSEIQDLLIKRKTNLKMESATMGNTKDKIQAPAGGVAKEEGMGSLS